MSASAELQKLVYDHLLADAAIVALVGDRIYDGARAGAVAPYITFGPSDTVDDSSECIEAGEETLQLDIWSEKHGRLVEARQICGAVRKSLKAMVGPMPDPYALVDVLNIGVRVLPDPDGISAHGVVTVTAKVEGE